jgi:hypothetical protein
MANTKKTVVKKTVETPTKKENKTVSATATRTKKRPVVTPPTVEPPKNVEVTIPLTEHEEILKNERIEWDDKLRHAVDEAVRKAKNTGHDIGEGAAAVQHQTQRKWVGFIELGIIFILTVWLLYVCNKTIPELRATVQTKRDSIEWLLPQMRTEQSKANLEDVRNKVLPDTQAAKKKLK